MSVPGPPDEGAPAGLSPALLATAFPFHLVLDRELRVVQLGPSVRRLVPDAAIGTALSEMLTVAAPRGPLTFDHLQRHRRTLFLLRPPGRELTLRGQVLVDDDAGRAYFLGSPFVNDTAGLERTGLTLADFAVHDPVVDYMFLLQAQSTALADAKELADRLHAAAQEREQLAAAEQRLARELDALPDLVLRLDNDGRVVDLRTAPDIKLPVAPAEAVGRSAYELFPELAEQLPPALGLAFQGKRAHSFEYERTAGQQHTYLEARVVRCSTEHALVLVRDVTERRWLQEQLTHQAFHDPLTGLANRALFVNRVTQALASAQRADGLVTVLFIDLDDFKKVNDGLGHSAGDDLLRQVTERLTGAVRAGDTVARLGGDEFAVLLVDAGDADAERAAGRMLASVNVPVALGEAEVTVGASIGIASARGDVITEDLLRRADLAMYAAKGQGKGCVAVYDPAMHQRQLYEVLLEQDLRRALTGDELAVHYQPIVELDTGRIVGVEALLRWTHPRRGAVPPATFIPVAERSSLILDIGLWVLRRACAEVQGWQKAEGHDAVSLSVNLSPRQLVDPQLPAQVREVLQSTGFPAERLMLELTETALAQDDETVVAGLRALHALGIRLALDDFGTGYSSLAHLRQFPIDEIKIDKSFIDAVAAGSANPSVARAVIEIGNILGVSVVAEGVESMEQFSALRDLNCALGQGYLFSRPLPPRR